MSYNALVRSRYGLMLVNRNDQYIGKGFLAYGEFSVGESDLFASIVKPGHIVIEVGANIGSHTVRLAQLVGETGRVIAFEPQRILFQTLCANLQLNNLTNVYAQHAAVGKARGQIVVPDLNPRMQNNFGALSLDPETKRGLPVPVVTLNDWPRCDFLKIDVEGMEQEVLEGATELIARSRPVIYVENDRESKSEALIRTVESLGYAPQWHTPPLFNPENYAKNPENIFGGIVSANMICYPKETR